MIDLNLTQIEQIFAARVANARDNARPANTAGNPRTTADQIGCALAELYECGAAIGLSINELNAITNRYVEYNDEGDVWPRPMGNVLPFGQRLRKQPGGRRLALSVNG
jgi:hypothetical protein